MKRTHLVAVLAAAAMAVFAADASAYYHPTLGRFLSRDPGPAETGPVRVGGGGPAVGGAFLPRDSAVGLRAVRKAPENVPAGQYRDGMGLYQYGHSDPISNRDPTGLECEATVRRINIKDNDLGHTWLNYPGNTMGFWPSGGE